jgi:hypothetical protein
MRGDPLENPGCDSKTLLTGRERKACRSGKLTSRRLDEMELRPVLGQPSEHCCFVHEEILL